MELSNKIVADFIIKAVNELLRDNDIGVYSLDLDEDLLLCVGWEPINEEDYDNCCIRNRSEENLGMVIGIKAKPHKIFHSIEELSNPVEKGNPKSEYDSLTAIYPDEDYTLLAGILLHDYKNIRRGLKNGTLKIKNRR